MLDLSNHALSITYLILWAAVFARQICLPVPENLFLLNAGTLAHGREINMSFVLCVGILGCLAGDLVWFEAGRHWGSQIMRILCAFSSDPHYCAQRAHKVFGRWDLRSLIFAKFIPGLDGVTPPLAGIEGSPRSAFLAYESLGSFLWAALYAGLRYVFAGRSRRKRCTGNRTSMPVALDYFIDILFLSRIDRWQRRRMETHDRQLGLNHLTSSETSGWFLHD